MTRKRRPKRAVPVLTPAQENLLSAITDRGLFTLEAVLARHEIDSGQCQNMKQKTNVVPLAPRIDARDAERAGIHAELLAFAEEIDFPGDQIIDQGTQEPTLDEVAETKFRRLFELFGITELDPLNPDFDLVSNTWYELTKVGSSLQSRKLFHDTLYTAQLRIWHPAYKAYVDALWNGDLGEIARCAKVMNIHAGIPESATRLRDGPMATDKGRQ